MPSRRTSGVNLGSVSLSRTPARRADHHMKPSCTTPESVSETDSAHATTASLPPSPRKYHPVTIPPIITRLRNTGTNAPGAKRLRALSTPDSIATRLTSAR